jgi:hypothetical protein
MRKKTGEAALVAGGKQLRDKAATQINSGQSLRVGGDKVELSSIRTSSPAMSMFGGSDNGDVGANSRGKKSREEKLLFKLLDSEKKTVESDILNRREE